MTPNKNTSPFDYFLMAYITRESLNNVFLSADKESEIVFSKQFKVSMPDDKVNTLLSSLAKSLSKDTLGSLVQKALADNRTNLSDLQSNTGLTPSFLEDIKTDMVFTNSVPVRSLVKLLKLLNVSIETALTAINTTFEKLSAESKMFLNTPANVQPAFRKGASNTSTGFDLMRLKSDESYLYQNKEALDKYTKRLGELYTEL
ncbi:MAG: helix-turn-helix domain-containing protein [Ginsengibacter sp.]